MRAPGAASSVRSTLAVAIACLGACGPGGEGEPPPVDGQLADGAGADVANRPYEGWVFFANRQLPGGADSRAIAEFREGPVLVETGVEGECSSFELSSGPPLSAGEILVGGGAAPFSLVFDPANGYAPSASLPVPLFAEGDMLTFSAPGDQVGVVGGFARGRPTLEGVVVPATFSRSAPATVLWTSASEGEIWIWLAAPAGAPDAGFLFCRTPDLGAFTIPAAAMAFVPASYTAVTPSVLRVDDVRVTTMDAVLHVIAAWQVIETERPID